MQILKMVQGHYIVRLLNSTGSLTDYSKLGTILHLLLARFCKQVDETTTSHLWARV